MMAHAAASQARVTHGARPGNTRGATGMSARVVAPVAPLRARTPGPQMTRRTPTLALNLAAASEGDGATPPPGGGAASTEKKRRRRRRAPKKKTADGGAVSAAKPKAAASGTADDTKSAPSKPNGRAASPPSPSKSSGGAVFMGTIDLDDNDLDDVLMRSLASRPDPNAVFRGTIDDDDLDLFATFDASDIDAKVSAAASRLAGIYATAPPPAQTTTTTTTTSASWNGHSLLTPSDLAAMIGQGGGGAQQAGSAQRGSTVPRVKQ